MEIKQVIVSFIYIKVVYVILVILCHWGKDIYFPGSAVFGESDKSTDEAYFDIVEAAAWSVIAQDYPPTPQQYMYFYRFLKHCNRN